MKATSLQFLQNNVDPATDPYVFLMGYYAPDDGGEGEFFWDSGNTDTANGGTIVASLYPGSPAGRWKRLYDRELNVKWFGAKGDGIANDVVPIQKTIAAMPLDGGHLLFPSGTYIQGDGSNPSYPLPYSGPADIGTDISFTFENFTNFCIRGKGAVIKAHPDNSCIVANKGFYFNQCSDGLIEGLSYDGSKMERQPVGGDNAPYNVQNGFHFDTCTRITVSDVKANYCVMDGFMVNSSALSAENKWSEDIRFIGCQANHNYRQGLSVVNGKRISCVRSEFSYSGDVYGTLPMAGIDFEEGYDTPNGRGQTDCLVDNCLFSYNNGNGLSFHYGTRNSRVIHSTFIENDFFNAPDGALLSVNNDIIGNTFINAGMECMGGGELIEDNVFNSNMSRSYWLILRDNNEAYSKGYSRPQIFRNNYIKNELSAAPAGTFGAMTIDSNNARVEGNQFVNILNTLGDHYVLFCNRNGYQFTNNNYVIRKKEGDTATVNGTVNFGNTTPERYAGNTIDPAYTSAADYFPTYRTYLPSQGNECEARISRLVALDAGEVFDVFLPVQGTMKVMVNGSYQATIADGAKEEVFWYGYLPNSTHGNSRKLLQTTDNANKAVHFTDVYTKNGRLCITGRQPNGEKQVLSVQVTFIPYGGQVVPLQNLEISDGYPDPGTLTFKNIYSGAGAGPSTSRPGSAGTYYTGADTGAVYLDTTLSKPIWFNGSSWIDASGTVV